MTIVRRPVGVLVPLGILVLLFGLHLSIKPAVSGVFTGQTYHASGLLSSWMETGRTWGSPPTFGASGLSSLYVDDASMTAGLGANQERVEFMVWEPPSSSTYGTSGAILGSGAASVGFEMLELPECARYLPETARVTYEFDAAAGIDPVTIGPRWPGSSGNLFSADLTERWTWDDEQGTWVLEAYPVILFSGATAGGLRGILPPPAFTEGNWPVGATYEVVVDVPEPASLAVVSVAGAGILLLRCRRRAT